MIALDQCELLPIWELPLTAKALEEDWERSGSGAPDLPSG